MKTGIKKFRSISLILFISITSVVFVQCTGNDTIDDIIGGLVTNVVTGWFGMEGDNAENLEELEDDIDIDDNVVTKTKVDLTDKLPPIGDQGSYGTCVAWSIGYNLKTYIEAVDKQYTKSQLTDAKYQFSPKDLFYAINSSDKGDNCDGTSFEAAFDVLVSRGVAPLSDVPYTNLGKCNTTPSSSWTTVANNYKIANYRKIDYTNLATLKSYLADGRLVAIGAKLGDNFMNADSDEILSSETYGYTGKHAYHAVALAGFDDSKSAFRVVNSWGTNWGDNGYIWIDYDFFVREFCFCAFVATNKKDVSYNPDRNNDGVVDDSEKITNNYDLVSWELSDYKDTDPEYVDSLRARAIDYNVYNVGEYDISKTKDWNILYVYYNAYNANDFGVMIFDYYSDDYKDPKKEDCIDGVCPDNYGNLAYQDNVPAAHKPGLSQNYWNNVDVLASHSVSYDIGSNEDPGFTFYYDVPENVTGKYYFVLIADGYDVIEEYDESNNYMYFTAENGEPLEILNGVVKSQIKSTVLKSFSKPTRYAKSPKPTVLSEKNVNAYTPQEIGKMLNHHKKTGLLQEKVEHFKNGSTYSKYGKVRRK
ncbi:MAG: C1 family peptidase [Bacteroidales bacterium]|nr:C1 family peptidase [Bacteroidales bacterium]